MPSLKVKDFDTHLQEWFNAKKNRYSVVTTKLTIFIYDNIKYNYISLPDIITQNELMTTFHYEEYARHQAKKMNDAWEKELLVKMEERKKNPNIWEPLFS